MSSRSLPSPMTWLTGFMMMFGCGMLVMSIMHIWREDMAVNICDTTYIYENYERMVLPEDVAIQFPRYDVYRYASRRPSHQKGALDSIFVEFVHSLVGRKKIFFPSDGVDKHKSVY